MNKKALNTKQKKALRKLHITEIILEAAFVVSLFALTTANIGSAYPVLGAILAFILLLTIPTLFMCGVYMTATVMSMRRLGKPLTMKRYRNVRLSLIFTWVAAISSVILFIVGASSAPKDGSVAVIIVSVILLIIAALLGIVLLISTDLLWRQFNMSKNHNRYILYGGLAVILIVLAVAGKYTVSETIKYSTTYITDASLELGQSEVRQVGKDGSKTITNSVLFGFKLSEDTDDPVNEQVAKGSKRFQYMYCSNGSYYYYTAEQFKNPNVGYTHQSSDQCAENGKGSRTALADVPPPEKIVQQVPVYRTPLYTSPTYTTCTESYFGSSFTCRSY